MADRNFIRSFIASEHLASILDQLVLDNHQIFTIRMPRWLAWSDHNFTLLFFNNAFVEVIILGLSIIVMIFLIYKKTNE